MFLRDDSPRQASDFGIPKRGNFGIPKWDFSFCRRARLCRRPSAGGMGSGAVLSRSAAGVYHSL